MSDRTDAGRDPDGRPDTTGASVMGSRPGDKPNQRPGGLARLAPPIDLDAIEARWRASVPNDPSDWMRRLAKSADDVPDLIREVRRLGEELAASREQAGRLEAALRHAGEQLWRSEHYPGDGTRLGSLAEAIETALADLAPAEPEPASEGGGA